MPPFEELLQYHLMFLLHPAVVGEHAIPVALAAIEQARQGKEDEILQGEGVRQTDKTPTAGKVCDDWRLWGFVVAGIKDPAERYAMKARTFLRRYGRPLDDMGRAMLTATWSFEAFAKAFPQASEWLDAMRDEQERAGT